KLGLQPGRQGRLRSSSAGAERQHVHREWRISATSGDVLRQGLITGGVAAGPRNANVYF
ncbi:hypothetical protein ACVIM5_000690, partial [Bradyrhizobium sp. USDA 4512]